jgi:uncharacterized RDD family membrane protein YckC
VCDCGYDFEKRAPRQDRFVYGGFWLRLSAYLLDSLILFVPVTSMSLLYRHNLREVALGLTQPYRQAFQVLGETALGILFWWFYYAVSESCAWQATLGKKLLDLAVVDYDGRRISFAKATKRYYAKMLSTLTLGLGFLMVAWTKRKQGLHDTIAKCLVVRRGSVASH